jgi:hypothetical protein
MKSDWLSPDHFGCDVGLKSGVLMTFHYQWSLRFGPPGFQFTIVWQGKQPDANV